MFRPPPPPAVVSYQQNVSRSSPSSANSQFVWPPKYVTTSTPVTNSSASTSPLRNFHNVVGLPVTSTQYKSPYAVPNAQSSSGSSQANGDNNNGYNFHHALPVSSYCIGFCIHSKIQFLVAHGADPTNAASTEESS